MSTTQPKPTDLPSPHRRRLRARRDIGLPTHHDIAAGFLAEVGKRDDTIRGLERELTATRTALRDASMGIMTSYGLRMVNNHE
ncbi:hypothetical protein ACFVHA_28565 [Bacillus cereus]|uniref:hypothetical protein n=1 Tax=Bacillus cereus TaxID=1396 RepID=UPI003629288A